MKTQKSPNAQGKGLILPLWELEINVVLGILYHLFEFNLSQYSYEANIKNDNRTVL